ncbi:MAG: S41 family peptidase [Gemmatimonadales bacterium]|nr:S41 family peptidase [Gemmatimonadales bacterium]
MRRLLPTVLVGALAAGIAPPPPRLAAQRQLSAVERQRIVAGVWAEARYNYAYWDAVTADWDSAFAALTTFSASRAAASDVSVLRRLRRWVALLNDGQAEVLPPAALAGRIARPPLALRSIERRPFIIDYATNDEMRVARPERLAEIVAVQGVPAAVWIRDSVLPEIPGGTEAGRWDRAVARMLEGDRGTALHLRLRLPGGEERGASVTRSVSLAARWPLERPALEADVLPDGVLWVRINSLADAYVVSRFERVLDERRATPAPRGVVLDLRETTWTPGGREAGYAILARLVDRPFVTARWRTPQYRPAYRGADAPDSAGAWLAAPSDTVRPQGPRPLFTGPVAILSSPRTAGPAEDLLVAFRNGSRGPIVGEPSAGSTGQTLVLPLAASWQLRLTVTRDAFPDGTEFVRTGIAPELAVPVTVDDVLAGRDAALDRARAYVAAAPRR